MSSRTRWLVLLVVVAAAGVLVWRLGGPARTTLESRTSKGARKAVLLAGEPGSDPGQSGAVVRGTVSALDGRPVDGATVVLARARPRGTISFSPPEPSAVTATAGGGRFRFENVAPGEIAVAATAADASPAQEGPISVAAGAQIEVRLTLGRAPILLSGRVLDAGGGSVPGATVRALDMTPTSGEARPPIVFQVSADGSGAYRLPLRRGRFLVTVLASGYASARQLVELANDVHRDFRLMPASRILGRVMELATRQQVAGAEVWLQPERARGFVPQDVKTDESGAFEFADVEPGGYRVSARKGRLVGIGTAVSVGVGEVAADVEVAVSPGLTVSGRVAAAGGTPIEGARVGLSRSEPPLERPHMVRSAGDGAYLIEGVLPGRFQAWAEADGYARGNAPLEVASKDIARFDFSLPTEARVTGKVLDAQGRVVAGAHVTARVSSKERLLGGGGGRTVTAADGAFEIKGLGPGQLQLFAEHREHGMVEHGPEALAAGGHPAVTLTLRKGGSLSGRVSDDEGRPVVGALVRAFLRTPGATNDFRDTTAGDGTYKLAPIRKGQVVVAVARRGEPLPSDAGDGPGRKLLSLEEGEDRSGIDFVLPSGGQSIAGTVVDGSGKPVVGATVLATVEQFEVGMVTAVRGFGTEERAVTDADGKFAVEDLERASYTVWVSHPAHPELERRQVAAPTSGLQLTLARPATISGLVVGEDGKPVPGYTIALQLAAGPNESAGDRRQRQWNAWDRPVQRVRDPSGAFSFTKLAAGRYDLRVTGEEGGMGNAVVAVEAGEQKREVRVTLGTGAKLVGTLVDYEDGAPIRGVEVRALAAGGAPRVATSDDKGLFALEGVGAGQTIRLNFLPPPGTHVFDYREIEVPADKKQIDLGKYRLLRGDTSQKEAEAERATRGSLGITAMNRGAGPVIATVEPQLPAGKAGLKPGDTLLVIDGKDVRELSGGSTRYLLIGTAGSTVEIEYLPAGATAPKKVTLTRVARR